MPFKPSEFIWHNGEPTPWEKATVHVLSHALHYGSSVFEGIRAYWTPNGTAFFRLEDHLRRLYESARIHHMTIPFTQEELSEACHWIVAANGLKDAYIRPIAYCGYSGFNMIPDRDSVQVSIAAVQWGAYLGEEGITKGVDVGVSSWQRPAPNTFPTFAKAGGNYLSSTLMSEETKRHGYTEAIALDYQGYLSEGPGENLFLVRDGVIYTPAIHHALLLGITRDCVIQLARDLGYEVREQTLPRDFLYVADELFFSGTAAEVVPIRSVDGQIVGDGSRGPITKAVQDAFFGLFNGTTEDRRQWLQPLKSHAIETELVGV